MIEQIKKLPYLTYKEIDDWHSVELLYIDYAFDEQNELIAKVFSRKFVCDTISIDKSEELLEMIENQFILNLQENCSDDKIIKISKKLLKIKALNIINFTVEHFINLLPSPSKEFFVLVPEQFSNLGIKNAIYSKYLTDEILFGKKTLIDEPGYVIVSNDEYLKDFSSIKMKLISLGFYPNKAYYTIKIID